MKNSKIKPWIVLIVCCGLAAASIGLCVNAVGVFYTPVSESLGVLRGTFAMHATISSLAMALTSLFCAKIMKKYPIKLIMIIGVLMAGISTIFMSYTRDVYIFYVLGLIRGIGSGLFGIVPLTMIINNWFIKNHGLATSLVLSFSGIAGALFSPIFTEFISSYGWETTYIIKGIILIVICLPAIIYPFAFKPQDEGLLPYGYRQEDIQVINDVKHHKFNFIQLSFICFFIFAILQASISGVTQHLPGFALTVGFNASLGGMLLSAGMIGNISSKLLIGIISDRLGALKATIIMMAINTIGIVLLMIGSSEVVLLLGAFLFGAVYSVGAVGFALLSRDFFGSENYSTVFPIVSFATNFGSAFSVSLVGYIYDFTGSYMSAFIISLMFNVINILMIYVIVKVKLTKKVNQSIQIETN